VNSAISLKVHKELGISGKFDKLLVFLKQILLHVII